MVKRLQIFVFLFYIILSQITATELFDIFEKCQRRDGICLAHQLQKGIDNYARSGIPELHLNPFDPLHLPHVKSHRNTNSPFNVDLTIDNMSISGLSKLKIIKMSSLDPELKTNTIDVEIPKLLCKGGYEVEGNILIVPINGKGDAKILLENVQGKLALQFKNHPRDGQHFGEIEDIKLILTPKRAQYKLDGLFNNNKELSDAMHELINSNSLDIYSEISPNIIKGVCIVLKDILNAFLSQYKYDDLIL